ncbi:MerR family transcriptional regulator [Saccharomonospora piscinae]|uniref:MerR family transcriptional regulator n=1 Tax=Saccharomonospora piscinae TaxID=687388 RepID=UPI0004645EA3|nr:MerR family transcriptional regulator [Saccharomonospora piscinae]TLW93337.1 MerR family transcriptional regulator [Saccharomonospora piscinae]
MADLSIGEVAAETGLSVHALRFFEREGLLLRGIRRSAGGRRRYEREDVEWLLLCNRLRESGMALATVRRFAELVRAGEGNERERLELLREHEVAVRSRIAELAGCLDIIHGKVLAYERHVRDGTAAGVWSPLTPD